MSTEERITHSIVLPIHNQADHVAGIVEGYLSALSNGVTSHELILVANGCTDGSVVVCSELEQRHESVRLLEIDETGWGRAVRAGLAASRGELVTYTNSARTTPETLVLMLLYATAYPHVVVKANRRIRESKRRRLGSLLYNLECRALFDLSVWDINGTPKIFPRSCTRLMELARDDDLIDLEFNVICKREGYPVVEVPILGTQRHGGRSTTNFRSAIRMYLGALELAREARR